MAINAIRSLYFPKFRNLMYTHTLLSTAFWLQQIVVGWLVFDQTKSPLFTSLAIGIDTIPILFGGFIGGSIVDRFNPKKCIIFVTVGQFIGITTLVAMMYLNLFSIWYIYPIVFFMGSTWVVYEPAKITLGMKLVDKDSITNIFGMWICGFNLPRIVSSVLAGYLIVFIGVKFALLVESLIIFCAFLSIALMDYQHSFTERPNISAKKIYIDLKNIVGFIKNSDILTGFFLLSFIPIFLLLPSTTGLLPVYASDVLELDARGLGSLQAFSGIGQITGIFVIGMLKQNRMSKYAIWCIYASACFGTFFAISNIYYLSILFIMFVNFCIGVFHNSSAFIMFTNIDEHYRGRLAGLQISSFGLFIVGTTLSGGLANVYGPSISTLTSMVLIIATSSIIIAKFRTIYSFQ